MKEAHNNGDTMTATRHSHTLKGVADTLGGFALSGPQQVIVSNLLRQITAYDFDAALETLGELRPQAQNDADA